MDQATHNKIVNFIWGIADDVLRDLFKRGKYPDVILPMCVIRRMDAVLAPTKQAVLDQKRALDKAGVLEQRGALQKAAGQAFYNTSKFTLNDLRSKSNQQQLLADMTDYLDGFSANVQDIITNFKFRNQLSTLSKADALGVLIEKFMDPEINLGPTPVKNSDGTIRHPAMDNHSMGTIFEELVRLFNEDNNEEAGQHWTPRDAVKLMADLVFNPIRDQIESGSYTLYDGACGTGGMLTLAEERLQELATDRKKKVSVYLYGQEINPETYAVCKADMLLKGEGENADNIRGGAEYSTLANDAFPAREFDFMISNPPYGKSWKKDLEAMGGKGEIKDPRFAAILKDAAGEDEEVSLVTRSSDGQMLFLANVVAKMKKSKLGSRIAHVHNGSSLFTGDAGQGESNIRRWVIENDWLEAIVALPLNMFYNTGIATYVWVVTNRKPQERVGKVQLIDATHWFAPLRKNLGKKNCQLAESDIQRIVETHQQFAETEQSKIFDNKAFGYWKVQVERPLRLVSQFNIPAIEALRFSSGSEEVREAMVEEFGDLLFTDFEKIRKKVVAYLAAWGEADEEDEEAPQRKKLTEKQKAKLLNAETWQRDARLVEAGMFLRKKLGGGVFSDFNALTQLADAEFKASPVSLSPSERKVILRAVSKTDESAPPVIDKVHKGKKPDPLRGIFEAEIDGKKALVSYEPDTELRDTEQVPLLEEGGIEAFIRREVLPYTPDAWIDESKTKIGYEVSFTRHFYKPTPLRSLEEIRADILAVEREAEGLLEDLLATGE